MTNITSCRYCGKTVRFLHKPRTPIVDKEVIAVDAETTAPEDTVFDPKRHVPHRTKCEGFNRVTIGVTGKKPCNCMEKKNEPA